MRAGVWTIVLAAAVVSLPARANAPRDDFGDGTLAQEMARRPVVLLGEVHDNAVQHAARAAALRRLIAGGARPAIAFEQFDRERQADIDRARRETPPAGRTLAEHVIEQARPARGWDWSFYRPFVQLALDYDLPIVAANLSRRDAMSVAMQGFDAVFDDATRARFGLDALPAPVLEAHERAIDEGHCNRMPAEALPAMARAQIARDLALAQSIRPYFARGVVLLTGNGHARNDIGIPFFLGETERARVITIGLLERDQPEAGAHRQFDVSFNTPSQQRDDPCATLPNRR